MNYKNLERKEKNLKKNCFLLNKKEFFPNYL